jgi:hypothetical protein
VLFVHGVGEQHRSQTLLWIGSALVEWVLGWSRTFYSGQQPSVGRVELSFNPFDAAGRDTLPFAVLHLPDQDWYMGEAWWAASNQPSDFGTMLAWSFGSLWDILAQMRRATVERMKYLFSPKPNSSTPNAFWRAVDLVNCVAVFILYFLAAIVGYPLLIVLMVLAQIPIEPIQNFIVLKMLRPLLLTTAGEFKLYMDDELQAGNVRRRIADAAQELMTRTGCRDLVVIAHSEGAVVSLGTLTDPIYSPLGDRVKLITLGGGLNKSWLVRPNVDRLFRPLTANVQWTDIYQPNGQPGTPISVQVTNGMEILTDHGGYFDNDEQVLIRLAAEISAPNYTDSVFWPLDEVTDSSQDKEAFLHRWVRKRRERVSALALWRDIAVAAWLAAAVVPWLAGWLVNVAPWGPLERVLPPAGLAGVLVSALVGLRAWLNTLPALFTPLASVPDSLLQMPAALGLAVLGGIAAWAAYRLGVQVWWSRWDRRDRAAFAAAAAKHSHERLSRMPLTPVST